ncbi:hypothetical protein [Agromyces sp. S2-1-8]|uniref:hypothetical protein n=1 Tax=Agromyces sp. S2-1-8 TaxID=2897180 RepID=UPI001E3AC744|nr:hypothetical protein [Agromyces sp. S2-1-8]MCD5348397.1 hypothetical protein [Agromyces sp. S2-1-8]
MGATVLLLTGCAAPEPEPVPQPGSVRIQIGTGSYDNGSDQLLVTVHDSTGSILFDEMLPTGSATTVEDVAPGEVTIVVEDHGEVTGQIDGQELKVLVGPRDLTLLQ